MRAFQKVPFRWQPRKTFEIPFLIFAVRQIVPNFSLLKNEVKFRQAFL
jgi:hypothetical protein